MNAKGLALIRAIAMREGTVRQLAERFSLSPSYIRDFTTEYLEDIKEYAANPPQPPSEPSPEELDSMWITNKAQRLQRLQRVADIAYDDIVSGGLVGAELATAVREFRSYLTSAANELGQLLHRGAGDSGTGDYLSVELNGVDMDSLR